MKMRFYYNLLYRIVWPFFCLVHPIRSIGRENIPEGGAVFCANHSALADPLMVCFAATLRWHIRPMAKIELSRVPLVGWLLGKAGVIYVDRGHADVKAVKEALTCLKAGGKMLVFPEGTRVHDGEDVSAKGWLNWEFSVIWICNIHRVIRLPRAIRSMSPCRLLLTSRSMRSSN